MTAEPYEVLLTQAGILEGPTWDGAGGIYFSNGYGRWCLSARFDHA